MLATEGLLDNAGSTFVTNALAEIFIRLAMKYYKMVNKPIFRSNSNRQQTSSAF
jgi:hypothetical protein